MLLSIHASDIAATLFDAPEDLLEVLAWIAERADDHLVAEFAAASSGSIAEQQVAPFLRRLADALVDL